MPKFYASTGNIYRAQSLLNSKPPILNRRSKPTMPSATNSTAKPAPTVIGPATKCATLPSVPLPSYLVEEAELTRRQVFDASRHLSFQTPSKVISMKDIGLGDYGISSTAVSDPFPLFTQDAIKQIRAEVFSKRVLQDCQFSSTFSKHMIRGMGPARAPFTYAAWNSPQLISYISQVAGIDLVPSIDFEIATINVSVDNGDENRGPGVHPQTNEPLSDGISAVAWHYDSFPFVCVVMISDCQSMQGGETALKTASGEVVKVRGPAMGTAVVLQGRYIEHQALKALGGKERISMVTCFRPRSPHIRDETVLTGVRGISHLSELYTQYLEYRLEILEERIRAKMKAERKRQVATAPFDAPKTTAWLLEQRDFINAMVEELTDY